MKRHFRCPICGPHVTVDEDGCCFTCGVGTIVERCELRLTIPQAALLAVLPDSPSDGRRCNGPQARVAMALVDKGYAKCVGRTFSGFGYFARTKAGEAASAEYKSCVSGARK